MSFANKTRLEKPYTYNTGLSNLTDVEKTLSQYVKEKDVQIKLLNWPANLESLPNVKMVVGLFLQSIDPLVELKFTKREDTTSFYEIHTTNQSYREISHLVRKSVEEFSYKKKGTRYDFAVSTNQFKKDDQMRSVYLMSLTRRHKQSITTEAPQLTTEATQLLKEAFLDSVPASISTETQKKIADPKFKPKDEEEDDIVIINTKEVIADMQKNAPYQPPPSLSLKCIANMLFHNSK